MQTQACEAYQLIQKNWAEKSGALFLEEEASSLEIQKSFLKNEISKVLDENIQYRLNSEFFDYGPLNFLFKDLEITEIIVNSHESIWFEKNGRLQPHPDTFFSTNSYENIIERICQKAGGHISLNHPYLESRFLDFRLTIIDKSLTGGNNLLSLRRHPLAAWTLGKLKENNWCNNLQAQHIQNLILSKKNFLIVGETGSGKTSVANACLQLLNSNERAILIEDCSELVVSNKCSIKLLTREDPYDQLTSVSQQDLIRRSLRLRPDRLVMGEIRSLEAKDFLMMLSTGHAGSFATLHARDPHEALIRLEMLVQLGAPQWNLNAIRRLIFLSLHFILITERTDNGSRKLKEIYKLASLEDSGFTLEPVEEWSRVTVSSLCV
jgi:pilus assembly protein CpaF